MNTGVRFRTDQETREVVTSKSRVDPLTGCWIWQGAGGPYGALGYAGKQHGAHRVSYLVFNGPIPEGYVVMHKCDVRLCVNPKHLTVGSTKDNLQDMYRKGRDRGSKKTHCKRGHPFDIDNTGVNYFGNRYCKECNRVSNNESKRRRRAQKRVVSA